MRTFNLKVSASYLTMPEFCLNMPEVYFEMPKLYLRVPKLYLIMPEFYLKMPDLCTKCPRLNWKFPCLTWQCPNYTVPKHAGIIPQITHKLCLKMSEFYLKLHTIPHNFRIVLHSTQIVYQNIPSLIVYLVITVLYCCHDAIISSRIPCYERLH
jgi:hypothetical protein